MAGVISTLKENGAVIAQAPWAFAIMTAVIIGVVWTVLNHLKANQIGNLESRLSLRDDEISDYKRKLEGATPDEAAERIERLEHVIAMLRPRQVTQEQEDAIVASLAGSEGLAYLEEDLSCQDAKRFVASLARAFGRAGWTVNGGQFLGAGQQAQTGIGFWVQGPANVSPSQQRAMDAFRAAGIAFDLLPFPHITEDVAKIQITSRGI